MTWSRGDNPFDVILGGYQIRNILEHAKYGSLLDLGCNDGSLTAQLIMGGNFTRVVGVDADTRKVELMRKPLRFLNPTHKPKPYEVHCSAIEDFDTEEKFDTVTLINVLEHVDDSLQVLKKAEWWLAPEGRIIIHVPNALGLNRQLGFRMGLIQDMEELSQGDLELEHQRFYDPWTLRKDIMDAGLKVEGIGGVMLKPFSNAQMQRIADEWDNAGQIFDGLYELAKEMPWDSSPVWAVCRHQ